MDDNSKTVYEQLRNTIWTSFITLIPNIVYLIVFCCEDDIKGCIEDIGTIFPTTVAIATVTWEVLDVAWFSKDKVAYKAEGKAERDAEWIEWAKNGADPDKMPPVVNPVEPSAKPALEPSAKPAPEPSAKPAPEPSAKPASNDK